MNINIIIIIIIIMMMVIMIIISVIIIMIIIINLASKGDSVPGDELRRRYAANGPPGMARLHPQTTKKP